MEKLTDDERKFFEMIKSRGTKKISLNLGEETINKIDELANIFKITRTLVIESIMAVGLKEYIKIIEEANKKIKMNKNYEKNKKLDEMMTKIAEFKKKFNI